MILFNERPEFETAWEATSYRAVMGGFGDDTIMLIAELYERGLEPDVIIFCDTGSEFPHTYKAVEFVRKWCEERKWSKVVVLRKLDRFKKPLSVITTAEQNNDLPAAAYGKKSCSLRYKTETADKYFNNDPACHKAWGINKKGARLDSHTGAILRIVGINADEQHRVDKWTPQDKWVQVFPLFDWGIGEHESEAVERVGLYYPGKSSCICCPHLTAVELVMLRDTYPVLFDRVKRIERNYQKYTMAPESTTRGLCRRDTIDEKIAKGFRDFEEQRCTTCAQ